MSEDLQSEVAAASANSVVAGPSHSRWRKHRGTLVAGAACLAIATTIWLRAPRHDALLCRNLLGVDAERICGVLARIGIPYKLRDNGSAVYVPGDRVHAARLQVVKSIWDSGDRLRFDLVDFSGSTANGGYTAALQGEIEATIRAIRGVESARVLMEMPGNSGRINGDRPLAVVFVSPAGSTTLSREQVDLIQNLVASSTDLLEPAEVTVSETQDSESLAQFGAPTL